ncbi:isocitrate lyase/phosphoenolpyruvate mutase family protein [Maritimibacter sp. UBA3975]|uniref:isocitrate lyase/PEP mutase family protein n=1 Tax=Maritimibacter sp. UBA3975 TaxID=1946833 RepID=UPI000C0A034A|nr:isocitrate lyase/phosphoenolpyruvate mutase family protein [Maritimibacter sp. UBA3975]MAM60102.1 PEP phosphonomutase [Maritimibacter sp.]|tara:strand:- start:16818 stop:17651 length:834 start_codon:yes stop_codon:yes gene_type:complete
MATDVGARFRALHQRGNPFILANAWDAGSARVLAGLGAEAIATSSSAHAFTLGRPDMGHVSREEALEHAEALVRAVNVPVSGDFENGFAQDPDGVAETVRLAFEVGLAGISIEDTDLPSPKPHARDLAIDRIQAAVAATRALPRDFVLVARADGVMNGQYDLSEAIARVQAYEAAGADCVYVPMPGDMRAQAEVCAAVTCPVNALAAGRFAKVTRAEFAQVGVARISIGGALARLTQAAILDTGRAMFAHGDFSALSGGASGAEIDALLASQAEVTS